MPEYYVPNLGIVTTLREPGKDTIVTAHIEIYASDLEAVGKRIVPIEHCGSDEDHAGSDGAESEALEGDYKCIWCREEEGDVTYIANLSAIARLP